ncbi:hypothetical protein B7R21_16490 [Subtercola boreus]|uniref:Abortive phage resistance protein n=1 Tax=Subtercola boreus TaxID=120213 RepID=A0A3E0VCG5_9MICO|nr:Abi family protein [Subtercola boreus]RFA07188.1 hypothetical protein B7R21_16490 [Subtercola boreus]
MHSDSTYTKPYLTVREQVTLLASRGMDVGDRAEAESLLTRIGYYRLSGYWYPFRERLVDEIGHAMVSSTFLPGTMLQHVCAIYDFDRDLRTAIFEALDTVEIALRFQIGHTLGRRNTFAHRDPASLNPAFAAVRPERTAVTRHQEWLVRFDEQERRSREAFAAHFRAIYGPHLPVWVATEVMSLGTLGQLYDGASEDDRASIAVGFDLLGKDGKGDVALLSNWLNHIRYVRNLCAHHSRLWNRSFDVELAAVPRIPELAHLTEKSRRRLYGTISILSFLLARITPESEWRLRVRDLIQTRTLELRIDLDALGFPAGWGEASLWSDSYRRDPATTRRIGLLAGLSVASTATLRDLLHSREPKGRRSWLNYLTKHHALMWTSVGEAKFFPTFQIDARSGDIHPLVGAINADLYEHLASTLDDDDRRSGVLEWWVAPCGDLSETPRELFEAGRLTLLLARTAFPTI